MRTCTVQSCVASRCIGPNLDLVSVADVGLIGADDPSVLEWAASEDRLVLTHDAATLIGFAYDRVIAGLAMPGIIEVRQELPIASVIDDLLLLVDASNPDE